VSEQLKYGPAHFKGHGGSGTAVVKAQEFVPVAFWWIYTSGNTYAIRR